MRRTIKKSFSEKVLYTASLIAAATVLTGCPGTIIQTTRPVVDDYGMVRYETKTSVIRGSSKYKVVEVSFEGDLELLDGNKKRALFTELENDKSATISFAVVGGPKGTQPAQISGRKVFASFSFKDSKFPDQLNADQDITITLKAAGRTFVGERKDIASFSGDTKDASATVTAVFRITSSTVEKLIADTKAANETLNGPSAEIAKRSKISGRPAKAPDEGQWSDGDVVDTRKVGGIPK
ncbi:hypothetical protein K2X30_13405 [bacterium]|nr:hypothetical protein [bacterium]